jgi:TonB family protein
MKWIGITFAVLIMSGSAPAQGRKPDVPLPSQVILARQLFFDFGPPFDYYDLFLIAPAPNGTSVDRISVTPAADECYVPAKVEIAHGSLSESVSVLLGKTNPCAIPDRELRREEKRCKHCLVFSGAHVTMRVECGTGTRLLRTNILDKDMFDAAPHTPQNTSWTMALLDRLDGAVGPNVMSKPMFAYASDDKATVRVEDSATLEDLASGKYDSLFPGADKLSELYQQSLRAAPLPSARLTSSEPTAPAIYVEPIYPAIAKAAHVEGTVVFRVGVDENGDATNFVLVSIPDCFQNAVKAAVAKWKFPKSSAGQQIQAAIEFHLNCPRDKH